MHVHLSPLTLHGSPVPFCLVFVSPGVKVIVNNLILLFPVFRLVFWQVQVLLPAV